MRTRAGRAWRTLPPRAACGTQHTNPPALCPPTPSLPRSANAEACELYKRQGAEAYKEKVLKFALAYPAQLAALKAKEPSPGR